MMNKKNIIALSGDLAAGKGTVSEILIKDLRLKLYIIKRCISIFYFKVILVTPIGTSKYEPSSKLILLPSSLKEPALFQIV